MGINNIQVLISPEIHKEYETRAYEAQAVKAQTLVYAHRRGEHPYGAMRRDCPLCQLGK